MLKSTTAFAAALALAGCASSVTPPGPAPGVQPVINGVIGTEQEAYDYVCPLVNSGVLSPLAAGVGLGAPRDRRGHMLGRRHYDRRRVRNRVHSDRAGDRRVLLTQGREAAAVQQQKPPSRGAEISRRLRKSRQSRLRSPLPRRVAF
jgi:hypothetical protein